MKIFVETEPLMKYPAGIAFYLVNLYRALPEFLPDMTLHSGFCCMNRKSQIKWEWMVRELLPNIKSMHSKYIPNRLLQMLPEKTARMLSFRSGKYDILHFTANCCPPWTPFDKLDNAVITIHDMFPFHQEIPFPKTNIIRYQLENIPKQAHAARFILTVSEFSKKEIVRFTNVNPEKIMVAPDAAQWTSEQVQTIPQTQVISRLKLNAKKYFLAVSALSIHKNYQTLLEAFDKFKSSGEYHGEKLVIAGSRVAGDEIIYNRIHNSSDIVHLMNLSIPDIITLYKNASGFFSLSRIEGFGMPLLEAMLCGCPACYARGSSMDEIGRNAAWSVHPDDIDGAAEVMKMMTSDGEQVKKRVSAAIKTASEYNWKNTAKITAEVFQKMK